MNSPDRYQAALANLQLPDEWQVDVAVRPRRRSVGIEVKPGGAVAVLIPPSADPEQVVRFVRSRRRWITEKVDTAVRLAPDHPVKTTDCPERPSSDRPSSRAATDGGSPSSGSPR